MTDPKSEPDADEQKAAEDDLVDEMSRESFPTSDPPSTWAGADDPPAAPALRATDSAEEG